VVAAVVITFRVCWAERSLASAADTAARSFWTVTAAACVALAASATTLAASLSCWRACWPTRTSISLASMALIPVRPPGVLTVPAPWSPLPWAGWLMPGVVNPTPM
jgi:hypothetical protein